MPRIQNRFTADEEILPPPPVEPRAATARDTLPAQARIEDYSDSFLRALRLNAEELNRIASDINHAFTWNQTPQGEGFWRIVYRALTVMSAAKHRYDNARRAEPAPDVPPLTAARRGTSRVIAANRLLRPLTAEPAEGAPEIGDAAAIGNGRSQVEDILAMVRHLHAEPPVMPVFDRETEMTTTFDVGTTPRTPLE